MGKIDTVAAEQTNRRLGYPADARLLIINADDFGMCHLVNAAIFQAFKKGVLRSTTLMVPCPWALHAIHFLADHPDIPFGVHLTVISDWVDYRWGPVTPRENVPSLIDQAGYFYNFEHMPEFLAQVKLDQLEMEFRAQIEVVLASGLQPTHLDWHALRIGGRPDISEVMLRLAYDQLLRELPVGLSEWAVHPGLDNSELLAIEADSRHVRQRDYDFLMSQAAQAVVQEEGILLLDYRALQAVWKEK